MLAAFLPVFREARRSAAARRRRSPEGMIDPGALWAVAITMRDGHNRGQKADEGVPGSVQSLKRGWPRKTRRRTKNAAPLRVSAALREECLLFESAIRRLPSDVRTSDAWRFPPTASRLPPAAQAAAKRRPEDEDHGEGHHDEEESLHDGNSDSC